MKPHHLKNLRNRIQGSLTDAKDVRQYFSTDGSVFTAVPGAVVYPRDTSDVQAVVGYAQDQAGNGKGFSVTGRGEGTNTSGAVIGDGTIVVFPTHMNRILRLTKNTITMQPGARLGTLQTALQTHDRALSVYGSDQRHSTVGGAVATHRATGRNLQYGPNAPYVKRLKVVLDDGSVIETGRLSRREVERKKGIMTREGDIYRGVDGLLQDSAGIIKEAERAVGSNSAGYRLSSVRSGGGIDLSQLFIGSQGTLGLITEITLATDRPISRTTVVVGCFDSSEAAGEAMLRLLKLSPSRIEFIDYKLLETLYDNLPHLLTGLLPEQPPKIVVLVEFSNTSHLRQNVLGRRAERLMRKYAKAYHVTTSRQEQRKLWGMQQAAMVVLNAKEAPRRPLPIIDDIGVPVAAFPEFLDAAHKLLKKHKLTAALWGGGGATFRIFPYMDLSKAKDRKLIPKITDDFYGMVVKMGGTISGGSGDGLLKGPYLERMYGREMIDVLQQVKRICDPKGIFNPGIKLGATKKNHEELLRHEYGDGHHYDHLPYR